jgi:perosamine synthetase
MKMRIPLSNPDITLRERKAVAEVLKSPDLSFGPRLEGFERLGADAAGRKYSVAVNSGTSGLHLIVRSLNISKGDEVITTPYSFIASANCLLFEGARPVFADIDEETLNISPSITAEILKKKKSKKVKAILAVDVFGHPADWDALYDISDKYNLRLIEDSCEAIGAEYVSPTGLKKRRWKKKKMAGSFGDAAVLAFYPNKQITTGEGGLILTDSKKIYDLCRSMRNQGRDPDNRVVGHLRLGYNYRLSDINCALGIAQLQRLKDIIQKRERVAQYYNQKIRSIGSITSLSSLSNVKMSWFVYVIKLQKGFNRKDRDSIMNKLQQRGISCSTYFIPIHLQPFYQKKFGYKRGDFPVSESVSDRSIALPFYSNLKRVDIDYITDSLKSILG